MIKFLRSSRQLSGWGGRGFVLFLTLVLMVLFSLVIVGIFAWLGVEYRIAAGSRKLNEARDNALLGMEMALSQLQSYSGPDQRVTASADIMGSPGAGAAKWTGVWASAKREPGNLPSYSNRVPLGWLVSGQPDPLTFSATLDASGNATSTDQIVLVGRGTLGGTAPASEFVVVPRIGIETSPGSANPAQTGSFAYWVGDEGLKALANLPSRPLSGAGGREEEWEATFNQSIAARNGVEAMTGFGAAKAWIQDLADDPELCTVPQDPGTWAEFAANGNADVSTALQTAAKAHFHDLTFSSEGLLMNGVDGGVRTDLTALFELSDAEFDALDGFATGIGSETVGTMSQAAGLGNRSVNFLYRETGPSAVRPIRGPNWHALRHSYRKALADIPVMEAGGNFPNAVDRQTSVLHASAGMSGFVRIQSPPAWEDDPWTFPYQRWASAPGGRYRILAPIEPNLAPILTRIALTFSIQRINGALNVVIDPLGTLWNPYDVPIEFDGFKVSFNFRDFWLVELQRKVAGNDPAIITSISLREMFEANYPSPSEGVDTNSGNNFQFVLTADGTRAPSGKLRMEPGQIVSFSVAGDAPEALQILPAKRGWNRLGGILMPKVVKSGSTWSALPVADTDEIALELPSRLPQFACARFATSIPGPGKLDEALTSPQLRFSDREIQEIVYASDSNQPGLGAVFNTARVFTGVELDNKRPVGVMDIQLKAADAGTRPTPLFGTNDLRGLVHVPLNAGAGSLAKTSAMSPSWIWNIRPISSIEDLNFPVGGSPGNSGRWGTSSSASGLNKIVAWEVPRAPWVSLASLQHADVGLSSTHQGSSIGNSRANPFVEPDRLWNRYTTALGTVSVQYTISDASYLANEALWDRFFFSGITAYPGKWNSAAEAAADLVAGEGLAEMPNPRLRASRSGDETDAELAAQLLDFSAAASRLVTKGAFNVNSTSVEAWKAVLAGLGGITPRIRDGAGTIVEAGGSPVTAFFSRVRIPHGGNDDWWNGYRTLNATNLESLAEQIVGEVKARGPFLSLGEFINRRLELGTTGVSGALQAAIERSNVNSTPNVPPINPVEGVATDRTAPYYTNPDALPDRTTSDIPGRLTQADILTVIGPFLSARSDTFRIRAYGDSINPRNGTILARAWCETIVQRRPTYVDLSDAPESKPSVGSLNERLGRRFEVVSFRWLREDEI